MIRTLVTVFAGLVGLAFGSFLNVCLSRWPEGESVVQPRSHCRKCQHTLAWWENIPLLSWIVLRGRCRNCKGWISIRYPLVELAVGVLWAAVAWAPSPEQGPLSFFPELICIVSILIFYWLMVALAFLDAENLWLPNFLTFPGIALGFIFTVASGGLNAAFHMRHKIHESGWMRFAIFDAARNCIISILVAAGLLLLIRWLYWVFRRREGMGLGDVKLIAMIAAWLGLQLTLVAFFIGALLGAVVGLVVIAVPAMRDEGEGWATSKLPFGTFLCIGGIVSSLWGEPIIAAYLRTIGISGISLLLW
jgi:leader peptidase (prepilin peptidase)/N-methyltransferase